VDQFAALADPTRRQILETLARQGRLSATEISNQFDISAQAISQHLKILRESQWVRMEKRAQQRIYQINMDAARNIEVWARQLEQLWQERYGALSELIEAETRRAAQEGDQS
jgi:DNA-binding transcriptional ArsR family regulator